MEQKGWARQENERHGKSDFGICHLRPSNCNVFIGDHKKRELDQWEQQGERDAMVKETNVLYGPIRCCVCVHAKLSEPSEARQEKRKVVFFRWLQESSWNALVNGFSWEPTFCAIIKPLQRPGLHRPLRIQVARTHLDMKPNRRRQASAAIEAKKKTQGREVRELTRDEVDALMHVAVGSEQDLAVATAGQNCHKECWRCRLPVCAMHATATVVRKCRQEGEDCQFTDDDRDDSGNGDCGLERGPFVEKVICSLCQEEYVFSQTVDVR